MKNYASRRLLPVAINLAAQTEGPAGALTVAAAGNPAAGGM